IEREIKFRLPEGRDAESVRAAVESAGFRLEPSGTIAQEDRYLDTEDWTLYRAGIALRLRADGHRLRLEAKSLRSTETESLARSGDGRARRDAPRAGRASVRARPRRPAVGCRAQDVREAAGPVVLERARHPARRRSRLRPRHARGLPAASYRARGSGAGISRTASRGPARGAPV